MQSRSFARLICGALTVVFVFGGFVPAASALQPGGPRLFEDPVQVPPGEGEVADETTSQIDPEEDSDYFSTEETDETSEPETGDGLEQTDQLERSQRSAVEQSSTPANTTAPSHQLTFDEGPAGLVAKSGAVLSAVTHADESDPAVNLAYAFAAGAAEAGPALNEPMDFASEAYTMATLEYRGDGTWNTLYLRLRDSTGEVFYYWLGNLNDTNWRTATVNLLNPTQASGGNNDGRLDAPITFQSLSVVRNGSQPATGQVSFDDLLLRGSGWTAPGAADAALPSGSTVAISFEAKGAGDYSLLLKDGTGAVRTLSGTVSVAGTVSLDWNGLDELGNPMQASISAMLTHDDTPDGAMNGVVRTVALRELVYLELAGSASAQLVAAGNHTNWSSTAGSVAAYDDENRGTVTEFEYSIIGTANSALSTSVNTLFSDAPVAALQLPIAGDGSYNTLFAVLQDTSGESYIYRVDTLRSVGWRTYVIPLDSPASVTGGDGNQRMDWPVKLQRLYIAPTMGQLTEGWLRFGQISALSWGATKPVPSKELLEIGTQPVDLSFEAPVGGDYRITLSDANGQTRAVTGTGGPGSVSVPWDGLSEAGDPMLGGITVELENDSSPDGVLNGLVAQGTFAGLLSVAAAQAQRATVVEGFEQPGAPKWRTVKGNGTLTSSEDASEGSQSLRIEYNLSGGSYESDTRTTPTELHVGPLESLQIDLKGNGTYNTLFLQIEDASGEVFHYRVGNLNQTIWATYTINLTNPPAASSGGNGDGILDAPIALSRLVVDRNGTQPASGSVLIDNIRTVSTGWEAPVVVQWNTVKGQNFDINFLAAESGDFRLTLRDPAGRTRLLAGTANAPGVISRQWDGKASDGASMVGVISAVLRHDRSPNGDIDPKPFSIGVPYLAGISTNPANTTDGLLTSVNSSMVTANTVEGADYEAALMESASVRYAREEFEWNALEPRRDYFRWTKTDRAVKTAKARNVEIIGKLVYTADWASSAPAGTPASEVRYFQPEELSDYVDYVTATVERYKDDVKVWEIWNEPNVAQFWRPAPNPEAYGRMVQETYAAIKAVQPDSIVLAGSLVGFSDSFMAQADAAGAADSYDGLSIHLYAAGPPESGQFDSWLTGAESYLARTKPGTGVWVTEAGWTTCESCSGPTRVTETQQAQYLARGLVDAATRGLRAYSVYSLVEYGSSDSALDNFGLVERSGRKKPAYTALSKAGAALTRSVSAGKARPTVGDAVVAHDLASTAGISRTLLGTGGTAWLNATTAKLGGAGALAVDYNFSNANAQGVTLGLDVPLTGTPTAVSMWVYGDSSNSSVFMKVEDATGEQFEATVGHAGVGWSRKTLYFDGLNPNYKSYGGNRDGKLDYPIKVTQVHLFKSTSAKKAGTIILDDLTAHYGPVVRGGVFYGRNLVTQALYSAQSSTVQVPVSHAQAFSYDRGDFGWLTVTGMKANTATEPMPKYIVSALGYGPNPARQGEPVSMTMITGDLTVATLQIRTYLGQEMETFGLQRILTSGTRVMEWNGYRRNGNIADRGSYYFWIEMHGPDGRSAIWRNHFDIR